MALVFPVVDIFQSYKAIIKFSIFVSFVTVFLSYAPQISTLLKNTMDLALGGLGVVDGLDLHCVAGLIGLDSFMNALFNMIFVAGTFYVSGMSTVLAIKFSLQLFGYAMRI